MDGIDIYADNSHPSYRWAKDTLSLEIINFINRIQTQDSGRSGELFN